MVTVTTVCALGALKVMGSETASAPCAATMLADPSLKVTCLTVVGIIALCPAVPLNGRAIVTALIERSLTPKALEKRKRRFEAGRDNCTVWRRVVFGKTALNPF